MSDTSATGRQVGHILLDVMSVWDSAQPAGSDVNLRASNLALTRLDEIGAVSATQHDDDSLTVDASALVGGALVTMQWLVSLLDAMTPLDRLEVVNEARAYLDSAE